MLVKFQNLPHPNPSITTPGYLLVLLSRKCPELVKDKKTRIVRKSPGILHLQPPRKKNTEDPFNKTHTHTHTHTHTPTKKKKGKTFQKETTNQPIFALAILFSSLAICFVNNCSFRLIVLLFRRTNFHINRLMIANNSAVTIRKATSQGSGSLTENEHRPFLANEASQINIKMTYLYFSLSGMS